ASDKPLFGAIGDSAPDRWGRLLMRRAERRRAEYEKQTPRTLREIDYLLMVDDEARQGALRFAAGDSGPFLAVHGPSKIPPLIELPRRIAAETGARGCQMEKGGRKTWPQARGDRPHGIGVRPWRSEGSTGH